jgi:hypothetical protein
MEKIEDLKRWAKCWWLTSVILVSQESEVRRTEILSQLRQIVQETLPRKKHQYRTELVEWLKWSSTCLASVKP